MFRGQILYFLNKELNLPSINSWVDFGIGNGRFVKNLRWERSVINKIGIDKVPHPIKNWTVVEKLDDLFTKQRDLFTSFDSIEHLEKEEGLELLHNIDKVFKYKIFITPYGFSIQDETTLPNLIKRNPWQKHLSGWVSEDFEKFGFKTKIFEKYHVPVGHNQLSDVLLAYKI